MGYEHLGSDDGVAQFRTPLATAHKFNGWADAFLDNGGLLGLRDAYVYVSPRLPWGLQGKLVYHQFWHDEGLDRLGGELDASLKKKFNEHVSGLLKFAWFAGRQRTAAPADRLKFWAQTTFKF